MKKLVFMFAAVVAMSFASCGDSTGKSPLESDTIPEVIDTVTADTVVADTANAE